MPTVNLYSSDEKFKEGLAKLTPELRQLLATELTCGEISLVPEEISVRIQNVEGSGMIAPIEVDITAHAFADRGARADKICLLVRDFVLKRVPAVKDVRVWLLLAELGHSWE